MRLSPHTAQHLWSFSMDIHEASVPISPAPQCIPRGQLARSLGTFGPIFPKARGLRPQSASWRAQLSWAPTTMPHPTPVRPSGLSLGSRLPTLHCPSHASQISRVHNKPTVSPLLTLVTSRNILLLQSLPNSIPDRQDNGR